MIEPLARPRVGIVVPGGADAWTAAVVARVATLAVLDRVPRARVFVLVAPGAAPGRSPLDCGRPWARLAAGDRQRFDVLLVCGGAKVSARAGDDACRVVGLPGGLLDVAILAGDAGGVELRRNRVANLRLLGWLPPQATTPHVVVDAGASGAEVEPPTVAVVAALTGAETAGGLMLPAHAGVDEVVAAVASAARYAGSHPVLAAIAAGAGVPCDSAAPPATDLAALAAAVTGAATAAVECWCGRGSPGAHPDPAPTRRAATQHAALRVEIRALQRHVEAAETRAAAIQAAADLVTGSRTWRYTERLRDAYHSARGRLHR